MRRGLYALFFGDFQGYSKLDDAGLEQFVQQQQATVAAQLSALAPAVRPVVANTWGDGLFFAFTDPSVAGGFALDLQTALGHCRVPVKLRVALHYGPANQYVDPITQKNNLFGEHVSRAARLEPATQAGAVYCTEAFALRCLLSENTGFFCTYVKNLPWAKAYGVFPTYRLHRYAVNTMN